MLAIEFHIFTSLYLNNLFTTYYNIFYRIGFLSLRNEDGKYEAFLTQFNSLDSFYIQLAKEINELESLNVQLKMSIRKALPLDIIDMGKF